MDDEVRHFPKTHFLLWYGSPRRDQAGGSGDRAFLQEWGSWAGQGPLCTDRSLYLEIRSKISKIPGAQICMILIYEFVLSQKSLTQKYSFYTKSKDIKVE